MIFVLLCIFQLCAGPYPIQFSISETKIVSEIPHKDKDFASLFPGHLHTYTYKRESDFYKDYQRSYFAFTKEKGGWDCLRHYEILANGCIPYFLHLRHCPSKIMTQLPKKLILEAMNLPGVFFNQIDHQVFDKKRYFEILEELLEYTRNVLSARAMAQSILNQVNYTGTGKILFLGGQPSTDYLRCCTLIGFKELLGKRVIDVPKIPHIYTNYPHDVSLLYGKGFTYTKIVEDLPLDRENIEYRIAAKEFDLIIYGSVHRGMDFHDLVQQIYPPNEILYFCGEDTHSCPFKHLNNLFLRENK